MAFKVFGPAATAADEYGDDANRRVTEHGVLEVWTKDRQVTYGPAGWWRVEEPRQESFTGSS